MRIFRTPPYHDVPELLDDVSTATPHELETTLRDIRRANIFGLGTWVVKHHLSRLLSAEPERGTTLTILDVATGSADIPQALLAWAGSTGIEMQIVATDISDAILRVARGRIDRTGLAGRVSFATCDASRLPFDDSSFDYATCSLALHHLDPRQARAALREMARVASKGFIVNDIYRSQGAWYMASALATLATTNRLTRHDGPASVMRAYTPRELRRLSESAGLRVNVYTHPFWRMAAVGRCLPGVGGQGSRVGD
ncbi:MAG: methyltransferase domain-containing protein [Chloroflexia bacterium]